MVKADKSTAQRYARLVARRSPKPSVLRNAVTAFLAGGAICSLGQAVLGFFLMRGVALGEAAITASAVMVGLGALLTGLGIYDEIGRWAGMGAALPITGFANAIVSPAMEYRREGLVLGVGARLFTIAGPVIVYAVAAALLASVVRLFVSGGLGG